MADENVDRLIAAHTQACEIIDLKLIFAYFP